MSQFKAASLAFQPAAVEFSVQDNIFVSGNSNETSLSCFGLGQDGLSEITSVKVPEGNTIKSLTCHPQEPLIAVANEKGTFIYFKENDQIELETHIPNSRNTGSKVVRFSSSGNLLATVSEDNVLSIFNIQDWTLIIPEVTLKDSAVFIDFDAYEEHLAIATRKALVILSIQDRKIVQVIDSPKLNKSTECEFFSCRYATGPDGQERLFGIVNTKKEHGFLCCWEIRARGFVQYPTTKVKTVAISRKKITSFAVSTMGDILAYASKDGSIGLVDIRQLRPLRRFQKVHNGEITSLSFNYSDKYIASTGTDGLCKVTSLAHVNKSQASGLTAPLFVILDMLLFALMVHIIVQMVDHGTLVLP